jgi:hypothetical protein
MAKLQFNVPEFFSGKTVDLTVLCTDDDGTALAPDQPPFLDVISIDTEVSAHQSYLDNFQGLDYLFKKSFNVDDRFVQGKKYAFVIRGIFSTVEIVSVFNSLFVDETRLIYLYNKETRNA